MEVLTLESFPPQYSLEVVSALSNGCKSYDGYRVSRNGHTFHMEIVNPERPGDGTVKRTDNYCQVMTVIPLGSDFESGETYTVVVNDVTENFVTQ